MEKYIKCEHIDSVIHLFVYYFLYFQKYKLPLHIRHIYMYIVIYLNLLIFSCLLINCVLLLAHLEKNSRSQTKFKMIRKTL